MKLINKIVFSLCALFIQSNSCIKAMEIQDIPNYPKIFNQSDILNCLLSGLEPQNSLPTFCNLCLTNRDLHKKYWDNLDFWKSITHNPEYINKDLLSQIHTDPHIYRILFSIEKDISDLMGISLNVLDENNRREENRKYISENVDEEIFFEPYEIEIRTSLKSSEILERMVRIRKAENKFWNEIFSNNLPLFSSHVLEKFWASEGAISIYFQNGSRSQYKAIAKKYLLTVFPKMFNDLDVHFVNTGIHEHIWNLSFESYWFATLSHDSLLNSPTTALVFALIARTDSKFYLVHSNKNKDDIYNEYKSWLKEIDSIENYFGKKFTINADEICQKRKMCFGLALKMIPNAEILYRECCDREKDNDEIGGLLK